MFTLPKLLPQSIMAESFCVEMLSSNTDELLRFEVLIQREDKSQYVVTKALE